MTNHWSPLFSIIIPNEQTLIISHWAPITDQLHFRQITSLLFLLTNRWLPLSLTNCLSSLYSLIIHWLPLITIVLVDQSNDHHCSQKPTNIHHYFRKITNHLVCVKYLQIIFWYANSHDNSVKMFDIIWLFLMTVFLIWSNIMNIGSRPWKLLNI